MTQQYLRKLGLIVTAGSSGLDLSDFRVKFETYQSAPGQTLASATIRVYNLADSTARAIINEFQAVRLEAGYQQGPFAQIFSGTIVQVKHGHESVIDSYVEMIAADGDEAYNFGVCNSTLAAGATPTQQAQAIGQAMSSHGVDVDTTGLAGANPALVRGKVLTGMARDELATICDTLQVDWFIEGGKVRFVSRTGYRAGSVVVLNSATGLVGFPEQTALGINMRCLLNPLLIVAGRVQIDNASVIQTNILQQPGTNITQQFAQNLAADGIYKAIVVEHRGDSRGNDWHTDVVGLPVGLSVSSDQSVAAYGGPA